MSKFDVAIYDSWRETYCDEDIRDVLKVTLNLSIIEEEVFDRVIEAFNTKDFELVNRIINVL